MNISQASDWSVNEMSRSRFPDERYRRVSAEIIDSKFAQSELSFSNACGSALRQSGGRLLRHKKVNPNDLILGHTLATVDRCMTENLIIISQDTSSMNFTSHSATTGLGPIGDSKNALGIHQHSALTMTENRLPLGVLHLKLWCRPKEGRSAGKRKKVPIEDKESYKWLETANQVEEQLAPYFKTGGRAIIVGDRESDIFDLFAAKRDPQMDLVVRAAYPRKVEFDGQNENCSLLEAAAGTTVLGEYDINVPKKDKEPARIARMQLRSIHLLIKPPATGVGHSSEKIPVWVVQAKELVPEGSSFPPLLWTLISTLDASTYETARRVVSHYTCRWEIELLHYTLKSGCQVEKLQMDDADTLCNTIAFYNIVAWRLLYIKHLVRTNPDMPAETIVDDVELSVLNQLSRKPVKTVADAVGVITRMGGHEPYKNGPPPGVKRIWIGMRKLEVLAEGWRLSRMAIKYEQL